MHSGYFYWGWEGFATGCSHKLGDKLSHQEQSTSSLWDLWHIPVSWEVGFEIFLVTFGHFLQNGHWIYQFISYKLPPKYYPVTINFIILLLPLNSSSHMTMNLGGFWLDRVKKPQLEADSTAGKNLWSLYPCDSVYNSVFNITHPAKKVSGSFSLLEKKP